MAGPQAPISSNPRREPQGQLLYEIDDVDIQTAGVATRIAGPWTWAYDGQGVAPEWEYEAVRLAQRPRWYPTYAVLHCAVSTPSDNTGWLYIQGVGAKAYRYRLGSGVVDLHNEAIYVISANIAGQREIEIVANTKIGGSPATVASLRLMIYSGGVESRAPELAAPPPVT